MTLINYSKSRVLFFLFSILFLLPMCTTLQTARENAQKRKMEKLIQKFSLDSLVFRVDTLFRTSFDTIRIPEIKYDTTVHYYLDSVKVIERDGVRTELKIMKDTFYLQNTVFKRDTVIELKDTIITIERIRTVDVTQIKSPWLNKLLPGVIYFLLAIVLVLISYLLYKKYIK